MCQLLDCSAAPMQGGEWDREFLPSKGRWGTLWKRREERVVKTWHEPLHRPAGVRCAPHTHSRQPSSLKLGLEAPSFWLPPGMERPSRRRGALAPQQLPRIPRAVNPAGSQSRPHPHRRFSSQDGGSEERSRFLLLSASPPFPPHPPCRGSQENDLSCWGGGGGGAGAGAQRAHSHTAAHCSCPAPSRPPHCGDTCPPGSAPAATPAPTNPIPGLGMCP